jgi:hypothetical protein
MKTTLEAMTESSRLIAYGDSFVHGDGLQTHDPSRRNWERHSPDSWPHLLGNKLGIPTINRGIPGGSNFGTAHRMLRDTTELNINQTDLVYVLLTDPNRIPIPVPGEYIYCSNIHFRSTRALKFLRDNELLVTPRQIAEAWTTDAINLIRMISQHTRCQLILFWGWFDIYQVAFPEIYDIPVDINQRRKGKIIGLTSELGLYQRPYETECGHWNELGHQRVAEYIYGQLQKANGSEAVSR